MTKWIGISLLLISVAQVAVAGTQVPEIDPGMGVSALTLLGGALLVIRARRKK